VIGLVTSDDTEGTVEPTSLTFDSGNWNMSQTVTVTGVDDIQSDGDVAYTIITTATSDDLNYAGLDVDDVSVTNLDDDAAPTMHVGDLDGIAEDLGKKWQVVITILVHDAAHNPVANATVSGSWLAGASGTADCTTNGLGECTVTSPAVPKNKTTITFAIDGVSHASLAYDSAGNHDPDGDCDGTTISVNMP